MPILWGSEMVIKNEKETAAIFDLYSHLLSDARLRRELFAEVDKGAVAEWAVKKVSKSLLRRLGH